jgi:hypothetical protein
VPLDLPAATAAVAEQLRLIADDGYAGPAPHVPGGTPPPSPALPRRKPASSLQRRQTGLF